MNVMVRLSAFLFLRHIFDVLCWCCVMVVMGTHDVSF